MATRSSSRALLARLDRWRPRRGDDPADTEWMTSFEMVARMEQLEALAQSRADAGAAVYPLTDVERGRLAVVSSLRGPQ